MRKLVCPSCRAGLKVAESLTEGSEIQCPKCGASLEIPAPVKQNVARNGGAAHKGQSAAAGEVTEAVSYEIVEERPKPLRRKSRPADDEVSAEEVSRPRAGSDTRKQKPAGRRIEADGDSGLRRATRKRRKKVEEPARSNSLLIGILVGVVVLLLGTSVTLAMVYRPWEKKGSAVQTVPDTPTPEAPRTVGIPEGTTGPAQSKSGSVQTSAAKAGSGSDAFAAGKKVFQNNCTRCHALGASGGQTGGGFGGGKMGRGRGPDLSAIGRTRDAKWLEEFIRDPTSKKPNARMNGFDGKISDADLKALAQYLASLK